MISRPPPPDPRSSFHSAYVSPHPTPPHTASSHPLPLHSSSPYHNPGLAMDPSVDFRAFYPYTPNEVKHRKRTTPTQLKTLESVFKRDTKPNGPLRVDLATKLGMTARGVQVWFQNRRAKEKIKGGKGPKVPTHFSKKDASKDDEDPLSDDAPDSPAEAQQDVLQAEAGNESETSSQPLSPPATSPQVLVEESPTSWQTPLDDVHLANQTNLLAYRRGSLPVNALFHTQQSANSPPALDSFDPFSRRLSVDASLQRLASNPYAPLARAKNGVVYGPRPTAPGRQHLVGRSSYGAHPPRAISTSTSVPYRLDMRRGSIDSRPFRLSPRSAASPSPSPLSPYHAVRASLPDQHLYTMTTRTVPPPLPGPLPSPGFQFGAANTPALSPGAGDSARGSPDSFRFTYREDVDEDETTSSYDSLTRFGSLASVATSDSSINSAYFPDITGSVHERDRTVEFDPNARRDSCTSAVAGMMSDLDMTGLTHGMDHGVYAHHDDLQSGVVRVDAHENRPDASAYPSPTSTVSPGLGGSPPAHDPRPAPAPVPISQSSELAYALQSQAEQMQTAANAHANTHTNAHAEHMQQPYLTHPMPGAPQYFYADPAQGVLKAPDQPAEYVPEYGYETVPHEHYAAPMPYLTDHGYAVDVHAQGFESHQHGNMYSAYGDAAPLDTALQSVETYVNYS